MSPSRPGPIRWCALLLLGATCLAQPGAVCAARCALAHLEHARARAADHGPLCASAPRSVETPSPPVAGLTSAALPESTPRDAAPARLRTARATARAEALSGPVRPLEPPPPRA